MKAEAMLLLLFLVLFIPVPSRPDVIEEIYAIVGDEVITYSELKTVDGEMTRMLQSQIESSKLADALAKMKKELMERLIEQKLILNKAKEKNYNVDSEVELLVQEIKKQNNLNSDDELKQALQSQGLEYSKWKNQLKEQRIQEHLIWDDIGSKIKVDNSEIMDFYRKNIQNYSSLPEITLNCIFLKKQPDETATKEKMNRILAELNPTNFEEVAKKYSELAGSENNYFLGKFKKGELENILEEAALKLKKGQPSPWLETATGYYLLQMLDLTEPVVKEYKEVREEIQRTIQQLRQQDKLKDYIEQLKKETYIKIFKEYQ